MESLYFIGLVVALLVAHKRPYVVFGEWLTGSLFYTLLTYGFLRLPHDLHVLSLLRVCCNSPHVLL